MDDEHPLRESLDALAGFLVGEADLASTLQRVVDLAAVAVPPVSYTGVTMLVDEKVTTSVFSDPDVPEIDAAQYNTGKGPCLDAFRHGTAFAIPSTARETRWPEFARTARAHGVGSTLSLPLVAGSSRLGAFNLYAAQEEAFDDAAQRAAEAFATQAAVVLANAQAYWDARRLSEGLEEAMRSRATIEQAKGIVMAQSRVDPDAAFELLRRASQRENRKLREIAAELVERHSRGPREGETS